MDVESLVVRSAVLEEDVEVLVGTSPPPAGPVTVWLLHGRGAARADVTSVLAALDAPSCTVLAPLGPWLGGAHWWVDSAWAAGRPVERALAAEVLPAAERLLSLRRGPSVGRAPRLVAGWSMGGAGALRWLVSRPGCFDGAVLLSPAAYRADPPLASSARTSGAFGVGDRVYDAARFRELMTLGRRSSVTDGTAAAPVRVSVLVGEDEEEQEFAEGWRSLRDDAAALHRELAGSPRFTSSLTVLPGGHDGEVWSPALSRGLRAVARWGGAPT